MTNDLSTLIKLAKADVDERRRALADRLRLAERLEQRQRALAEEISREQEVVRSAPVAVGETFAAYAGITNQRRRDLERALTTANGQIAEAREDMAAAYRHQQALELAQAARDRQRAAAAARAEQNRLDEIALQRHRRSRP